MKKNQLTPLGEKIFLDRYALKDGTKESLEIGSLVIVQVDGQREVGNVLAINGDADITVELKDGTLLQSSVEAIDLPLETTVEQMMDRVARGAASVEEPEDQAHWQEEFRNLLDDFKFLPGGRILAGCGTDQNLTYFNCYVLPSPKDSREGLFETLSQMAEIMSRGGGVGINLSSLRPQYSYVKGVNGRSSGAVSWGGLFSFTTGLIEQGGSRRGALMLILNDWHPDILSFIDSKREAGKITNANISVGVSDAFMAAVEADDDWELRFPDTSDPYYHKWNGDLYEWEANGGGVITHSTVKAKEVWNRIMESAWSSAEPGVWFIDRANNDSNAYYFSRLISTNPCGEISLSEWGVCNLGHINLSKFVLQKAVDWRSLASYVMLAVRFLDNIIDVTPYFFKENEKVQKGERRIGLGTMGLAEMLIKLEIRYGSEESLKFVDGLYSFIARHAYIESANLAKEKGMFPEYDEQLLGSRFMQRMSNEIHQKIYASGGLRNVNLLTQAPTGTVGTMVNTSTGIEPFYYWSYIRKGHLGSHEEKVAVVQEWEASNPGLPLPDFFVSAMDLSPSDHVKVQAAIQKWTDQSISKTCNCPSDYTIEQTKELYELMYKLGCKGGTIYRDKSRDEQVLNLAEEEPTYEPDDGPLTDQQMARIQELAGPKTRPRPYKRYGATVSKSTPAGTAHVTMNDDERGNPLEIFIDIGKGGSDIRAMAEAIGRLASLVLRVSSPLTPMERVDLIVGQLSGIGGPRSSGFGKTRVLSLPDGLAQALEEHYQEYIEDDPVETPEEKEVTSSLSSIKVDLCPGCGNVSLVSAEGCQSCFNCGHAEC